MEPIYLEDQESHGLVELSAPSRSSFYSSQLRTQFVSEFSATGGDSNTDIDPNLDLDFVVESSNFCQQLDDDNDEEDGDDGGNDGGDDDSYKNATATASTSTDSKWTKGSTPPVKLEFTSAKGLQVDIDGDTPLHYLKLMISDKMVETITNETNRYATQSLATMKNLSRNSRFRQWTATTTAEMWTFLGLIIAMGLIVIDSTEGYWNMDEVYNIPFIPSVMLKDRFFLILSFLHFNNQELQLPPDHPDYDPLSDLGEFISDLATNFRTVFLPGKNMTMNETIIPWRGQLKFSVYEPNKPVKAGIKIFELCDTATLYCSNFEIYTGKRTTSKHGKAYDLVERLITPFLDAGRTLYTESYFTSPNLFNFLGDRGTQACGTLRSNRENNPPKELTPSLKNGDSFTTLTDGRLNYFGFMDGLEVRMLTTAHNADVVTAGTNNPATMEPPTFKLQALHDYNHFVGTMDKRDEMVTSNGFNRRTLTWWKKVFFDMFMLGVLNAYLVCEASSSKKISYKIFRRDLAKQLAKCVPQTPKCVIGRPLGIGNSSLFRLTGRHFPSLVICKPGAKRKNPQRECAVCSLHDVRKYSRYECAKCDVGIHVDRCFEIYHTTEDYKTAGQKKIKRKLEEIDD